MNKKEEMITALESHYKSLLDRTALDINDLLDEGGSKSLDSLIDSVDQYSKTLNQFNFVQKLKENLIKSEDIDES